MKVSRFVSLMFYAATSVLLSSTALAQTPAALPGNPPPFPTVACVTPVQSNDTLAPVVIGTVATNPTRVNAGKDHILQSLVSKGSEIAGPGRVVLLYVNRLRYSFTTSIDIAIIQNASLPDAFTAPSLVKTTPVAGAAAGGAAPALGGGGPPVRFDLFKACVSSLFNVALTVDQERQQVTNDIQTAKSTYESILNSMPSVLSKEQAETLKQNATVASAPDGVLRAALKTGFPSNHARVITDAITAFGDELTGVEGGDDFKAWAKVSGNLELYLAQKARLAQAKATIDPWLPGKAADIDAATQQRAIALWMGRMAQFATSKIAAPVNQGPQPRPDLTDEDLALAVDADCKTIFGRGKTSTVSYVVTDLFASDNQVVSKAIAITCLPVLAVTTGIGFSTLGDQTPAFVDTAGPPATPGGPPTVVQQLGYSDRSSVKPLYMVQVNGRLFGPPDGVSGHASLGIGAVNRNDTTTVEFILGGSISFKSAVFVTLGLHFGKQAQIGGGFTEGEAKPADLDAIPTTNGLRKGFAISVTFPIIR